MITEGAACSDASNPSAHPLENLVHGNQTRRIRICFRNATIQLGLLCLRQREHVRRGIRRIRNAIPDIADELETLGNAQAEVVKGWLSHMRKLKEGRSSGKGKHESLLRTQRALVAAFRGSAFGSLPRAVTI